MLPTPRGPVLFAQVDIALLVGVTLAVRGPTTLCRRATHRGRRSNKSKLAEVNGTIGGRQGRQNTRNLYPRSPRLPGTISKALRAWVQQLFALGPTLERSKVARARVDIPIDAREARKLRN